MKKYYIISVLLLIFNIFQSQATTNITSNITTPTNWNIEGSPYKILNNIIVQSVLTIQPGVEIRFLEGIEMEVTGRIVAIGTADSSIQFLPEAIDQDTRYWGKITMNHSPMSEPSQFEHCIFRYGGFSGTSPLILKSKHIPIFHNLTFLNNRKNAITVDSEVVKYGVKLTAAGVPYTFLDNCYVEKDYDFELEPGVVLKLPGAFFLRVRGNVIANGSADKPIIFTSFRDDEIDAKDTDNLGSSKGVAGDWGGIILEGSINHGKTAFRNCIFRFGGGSMVAKQSFLFFFNSMARVDYCTFEQSAGYGVSTFSEAMPDLGGGHLNSLGHNKFIGFDFNRNAVSNASYFDIPAMYNCWGRSTKSEIEKIIGQTPGKVYFEPFLLDCSNKTPCKTQLISPADSSIGIDSNSIFRWRTPLFSETYRIEVSKTSDFFILSEDIRHYKDTIIKFNNFKSNTEYFWRVASENFTGIGEYSDVYSFRTKDTNLPKAPANLSPIDITIENCSVSLRWDIVPNSDNIYEVYFRANDSQYPFIINERVEYSNSFDINAIPAGREFIWQVRAWNETGWGDWSDTAAFSTRNRFIIKKLNITNDIVQKVYSADINNDALFDIILQTEKGTKLLKNLGNQAFETILIPDFATINQLEFADLTNDNRIDFAILGTSSEGKQLFSVERYSAAKVHTYFNFNIPNNTEILSFATSDFNNNGQKDIILKRLTNNAVYIDIYINSAGSFVLDSTIKIDDIHKNNNSINLYDIDKNGASDIILLSNNLDFNRRKLFVIYNHFDYFLNHEIEIGSTGNHYAIFDRMLGNKPKGYADIAILGGTGYFVQNLSGKLVPFSLLNFPSNNGKMKIVDIDYNGRYNAVTNIGQSTVIHQFDYPISDSYQNFRFEDVFCENNDLHLIGIIDGQLHLAKNNNCRLDNLPPTPINLRHTFSGNDVILEWSVPRESINGWNNFDYVNPEGNATTFNIRVGTSSGSYNIIAPESDPLTGKLFTNNNGNAEYKYFYVLKNINEGKYYWSVQSINESLNGSLFAKETTFDTREKESLNLPNNWLGNIQFNGNYSVITIANDETPRYEGNNFDNGDAIAAYLWTQDSLIFLNYAIYEVGKPFQISCMSNRINDFVFQIFRKNDISISFIKPKFDNIYINHAYTKFNHDKYYIAEFDAIDEFEINLSANKFSLISSPLRSYNTHLDDILPENVPYFQNSNSKIFIKNGARDFDKFSANEGYLAYSTNESIIKLQGNFLNPNSKIHQFKLRWNILPYPYNVELPVESVYGQIPFMNLIINSKGEIYYPDGNLNTIGNIKPGEAVKAFFATPTTHIYPESINANTVVVQKNNSEYFTVPFTQTGKLMIMIIEYDGAKIGDEIAVISHSGEVYGATKFIDNKAVISIWGNNLLTENTKEGALENEPLRMRYYSNSDNKLSDIIIDNVNSFVSYETLSPFQFRNEYAGKVEITSDSFTSINETIANKLFVYPNPADNYIHISYDESLFANNLEIINALGVVVYSGNYSHTIEISNLPSGIYMLRIGNQRKEFIKI